MLGVKCILGLRGVLVVALQVDAIAVIGAATRSIEGMRVLSVTTGLYIIST